MEDELEVTEGIKFDRGYISPYFMTETKGLKCQYENALVLINQTKISDIQPLVPALELAAKSQRPIVIIAEDIDSGQSYSRFLPFSIVYQRFCHEFIISSGNQSYDSTIRYSFSCLTFKIVACSYQCFFAHKRSLPVS